jgi:UDP-glucose 4-epimerase
MSKREAEQELALVAGRTGLEVVVIRPPLVYGPGAKANFRNMMKTLSRGVPLPFGAVHNRRSLVSLANLVDLVLVALVHPDAPGKTFLVSDGEDLSTTELLRRTTLALGRQPRLLPVSEQLLRHAFDVLGRRSLAQRLLDSLEVDIVATCETLGWRPPVSVDQALVDTAQHYLRGDRCTYPAAG